MGADTNPVRFPATSGDITAAAMRQMLEMVLGSRLTFSERLDSAVLKRAVRMLLDLEPVLGCWYDEKLRGAEWVRCTGLDETVPFSVVESTDPDRAAVAFHATPFTRKGPRLAVQLIRSAERDDLCVRFDHVAGDGWSAMEVTHLLAEMYTRLLADPDYLPEPRTAPRPTHADVWDALTDEQREVASNPPRMSLSKWKMKTRSGGGSGFDAATLTLSSERVAAIREYAHERGATVFEALVAAVLRSADYLFPVHPGVMPGVSISADTRRFAHSTELDRPANIATTQNVMMEYRRGEAFDETLQHVVEGVRPYKQCLWTIGSGLSGKLPSPMAMRAMFGFITMMMRSSHAVALIAMNLGAFDEERLRFGNARPVSAVATGPVLKAEGLPLTLSYYRGALSLWIGYREARIASEMVGRFLRGIEEQLAAAV